GIYHLLYKTEGHRNGVKKAMTDDPTSGVWTEQPGYKQQNTEAVEGSSSIKLTNTENYILLYDRYIKGADQFYESNDLDEFQIIDQPINMDFHPRHGSIITITRKEYKHLLTTYGTPDNFQVIKQNNPVLAGYHADPEILYAEKTGKYYLYPTS